MVWPIQQQRPNSGMLPRQGFFPGGPPQQPKPGVLQQLLSPERISSFSQKLSNVQQALNVVQQAAPMVKQYGPMVKNLPALLKLMKALNEDDSDADEDAEEESASDPENNGEIDIPESQTEKDDLSQLDTSETPKSGESTPKLFI